MPVIDANRKVQYSVRAKKSVVWPGGVPCQIKKESCADQKRILTRPKKTLRRPKKNLDKTKKDTAQTKKES